ncbi:PAS domain S-box protein [Sulfuriferula thiophila]|uniref:PAS domain S-box protein n=1 Tax=Sulfuriferula thiophila TaxID=1781211 RepID=UPI000F61245F|nr:PAS domain S-box protein [Sulfuriferula thiophila]
MVVMLLMVFLVTFGLSRLHSINQQLEQVVNEYNVKAELAYKMQFIARERIILLQSIVATEDVFDRDILIQRFYALSPRFMTVFNEEVNQGLVGKEKLLVEQQRKFMAIATSIQDQVLQLVLDGKNSDAVNLLIDQAVPAQDKTLGVLAQLIDLQFDRTHSAAEVARQNYQRAVYSMVVSGIVAFLLSLLIAYFVNRRMSGLVGNLRLKEQEARVLLDNIPDLVWLKNSHSRYVWANQKFEQAAALMPEQVVGLLDDDIWFESGAVCQNDDRQAIETRCTVHHEKTLTNRSGVSRQYVTSRTAIFDETGQCTGVLGVAHDVTERNRMAEQIQAANIELQFQKTALDQHAIVSIADVNGVITYVNDKFCEISKYGRDELLGLNHRVLKSGCHQPEFYAAMWKTIASGKVWEGEVCNLAKDGSLYWVKTTIVPFVDANGLPQRYISIRTDITPAKSAELLLQRSHEELEQIVYERTHELVVAKQALEADIEARRQIEDALNQFKATLDQTHDSVFMFAPDTLRFIYVNRGAASQVGYSIEALLQMTPLDLKSEFTPEDFREILQPLLSGQQSAITFETTHRHKDGHEIPVEVLLQYIHPSGGEARFIAVVRDIAERKRTEGELIRRYEEVAALNSQLQETQSQLLQSEKMASIGQLAAGVAHEINNPIGYVHSNLGTLEKYVKDLFGMVEVYEHAEPMIADVGILAGLQTAKKNFDLEFLKEDVSALMSESRDGITRVKKIVQDLKDFSHVDTAEEWHWADLIKGIDSTLNIVNNEIKYKAQVVKEYQEIPDVECLSSQLNQVFMNLLVNAVHAIEERGTITIRTGRQGDDEVWVEIADTGKGIAPENLKKIFDPFFTTKPIGKGTGLGLSLSYGIIHKHHGRIEVQSEVDRGTTFRVCLPVRHVPSEVQVDA